MNARLSLLIPFSSDDPVRIKNFEWLLKYWQFELPDAEIVIGHSTAAVFCKGEALNNAAERASGDVFAIVDADALMDGRVLTHCANRIWEEAWYGNNLWYVPYRNLYRLNRGITKLIVGSNPEDPLRLSTPPHVDFLEGDIRKSVYGSRYGAMIMMFPRHAYELLRCFDERFSGWGGEDVALLRALDTVFGKHKTIENDIFHLWHPAIGNTYDTKMWAGQKIPGLNNRLAVRYNVATRKPSLMQALLDESFEYKNNYNV